MVFPLNQILNASPNLQLQFISKIIQAYLAFFQWCWRTSVSLLLYHVLPQSGGKIFLHSHPSFTAAYSLKSEKIGLLILINCEPASLTVFTIMCPKEQQTSDNLIVKDYCFIIEIFDKFSFSGILRGCLSRLKEA